MSAQTASAPHATHAVARDHCLAPARAVVDVVDAPPGATPYGRMFPGLPALDLPEDVLLTAGDAGGVCDAAAIVDDLARGGDDAHEAAIWPFFGQFVAHDVTADRSAVGPHADVALLRNARSPRVNLESVHGAGPAGVPYLYDVEDGASLLVGHAGLDLPRNQQGVALVGDPRDDVHLFVASLHLAFLHAHNGLVARLREDGVPAGALFDEARRALVWHYQWIVLHDFLPRVCGPEPVGRVLAEGGRWFRPEPGEAFVPLEFADAAYRYGHGQIRHRYRLQVGGPEFPLFPDLVGFGPIRPEHRVDWALLADIPGMPAAQRAKKLDGRLPASLIGLPRQITGDVDVVAYRSLAVRDLLRGTSTGLPSGEELARHVGVEPLHAGEIAPDLGPDFAGGTPLWLYVLREAGARAGGDRLGPLGALIVAEVLVGLIRADADSYLSVEPGWRPTLPAAGSDFGLADLLVFADRQAAHLS